MQVTAGLLPAAAAAAPPVRVNLHASCIASVVRCATDEIGSAEAYAKQADMLSLRLIFAGHDRRRLRRR